MGEFIIGVLLGACAGFTMSILLSMNDDDDK